MLSTTSLAFLCLASFSHVSCFTAAPPYPSTCGRIASSISSYSQVFYPNTTQYIVDNEHALISSTQVSECSVEPGSVEDVSAILSILGSTRTPFGVKGGGHIANPGVELDSATGTVDVGSGVTWIQVYEALDSTGFSTIGGRFPNVGVSGLTLGGGYSFMSNQYGLTIDNMVAYELVLPNGTITNVTSSDKDLWFALRGGGNNFGIVTKFTFKAIPQGQIWGGTCDYTADQLYLVKEAHVKFQQQNDDPKAVLNVGLSYSPAGVTSVAIIFYDAPTPAPGIFDDILAIPTNQSDIKTRSLGDIVNSLGPLYPPPTDRGFLNGISVTQYSPSLIDTIVNQILFWGRELGGLDPNVAIAATMEPFASGLFSHGSDSAYPPDRSHAVFPTATTFAYGNASLDETMAKAMRNFSDTVTTAAIADGQNLTHAAVYPNYALYDTPLEDMYGANLPRLRAIKKAIDPENVMGLAGGFKL